MPRAARPGARLSSHDLASARTNRLGMTVTSVVNPATEQVIAEVPQTSLEEADRAIESANRAFESWRQVAPADRGRLLSRFAEAVDADREELAQLEVRNSGHTIGNARWEAGNVRDVLNYYSAAPERLFGQQIPISAQHRDRVASYVPEHAGVAFRGQSPSGTGYWYPPTVLAPIGVEDRAFREEIFGPVVAVAPFDDEADAIRVANNTEYGLSGSIWTRDVGSGLTSSQERRIGQPLGQFSFVGPVLDALWRI